ncbi:MAG: phosphoribosylformylglycinamidine cyclo-ligase [Gammaproteobacteria bacterium]|nr:phosphoribosylformylglycinamidine cyclo-ligase [Gammaproteobacteria bacterium]
MVSDDKLTNKHNSMTYRDAGVNITAGNALVRAIKSVTARTHRSEVLSELGGFGALCELPEGFRQPVLVSATDGVGTKLKLAMAMQEHHNIGIDLVAMCVNDLIVCGAEPLFFLDYYATGRLNVETATAVVSGIGKGCEMAGCALIGGETAEMPGMYTDEDYDLAGFAVGVVEKSEIIEASRVVVGDCLIGIDSTGPHANGYSLIRNILERNRVSLESAFDGSTLGETLLAPTQIYVKAVQVLAKKTEIHAIAHITGGGLIENLPRVLPENACANINLNSWVWPPIFSWLQEQGKIAEYEMYRTFNCGIGLVLCIEPAEADLVLDTLSQLSLPARVIGSITERTDDGDAIYLV